jgi:hypothetical protein
VFYWGQLMAGALLGSFPVAMVYSFFVEQLCRGADGGVGEGVIGRRFWKGRTIGDLAFGIGGTRCRLLAIGNWGVC